LGNQRKKSSDKMKGLKDIGSVDIIVHDNTVLGELKYGNNNYESEDCMFKIKRKSGNSKDLQVKQKKSSDINGLNKT
jgi:hypothetical protein